MTSGLRVMARKFSQPRRTGRLAPALSSFAEPIFFNSPSAFGDWLSANHDSKTEVFVGYHKKHTGRQVMSWSQAVDEALCWGWIDGQVKSVDANRTAQRFTPRAKTSHWSRINVDKVAMLEAAGRMCEPGKAAFARRTEENTAQMSFEREAAVLTDEFASKLAENVAASTYLNSRPPGYKRQVFHVCNFAVSDLPFLHLFPSWE
jgi:uncharacterized protein YdeI (YjbR/CyaY-like superfamily)